MVHCLAFGAPPKRWDSRQEWLPHCLLLLLLKLVLLLLQLLKLL